MIRRFASSLVVRPKNTSLYRVTDLQNYVDLMFAEEVGPREKKVMLVRHAQSEGNTKLIIYGHGDYELTEVGIQQAMYLQGVLSHNKERFTDIYSSILRRTFATGGVALGLGTRPSDKDIARDYRFNEFNFGPLEGISFAKMDLFDNEFFFQMYPIYDIGC